jgi:glycosyltransferase involved in cell wall biosynthesis
MQERKGFHILIDAVARVRRLFPDVQLLIIGGPAPYGADFTKEIQHCISAHGLSNHVRLMGRIPHKDLNMWYSAADLFALLSSREGSPNVLLEALACGTPAVATAIGGIPQELADSELGLLVPERSADCAASVLEQALARDWNRESISLKMRGRTWEATAAQVHQVFMSAVSNSSTGAECRGNSV